MPVNSDASHQYALSAKNKKSRPRQNLGQDSHFKTIPALKCLTLFGLGGVNGAYAGASAALDAGIGIDYVALITLRDSGHGTLTRASATLDAIAGNLISH
jgi:hypothetical protein